MSHWCEDSVVFLFPVRAATSQPTQEELLQCSPGYCCAELLEIVTPSPIKYIKLSDGSNASIIISCMAIFADHMVAYIFLRLPELSMQQKHLLQKHTFLNTIFTLRSK